MSNKTMTTSEAWVYIRARIGKPTAPYYRKQMDRYRAYGQITPHIQGTRGEQNVFLVADLDAIIEKIKAL